MAQIEALMLQGREHVSADELNEIRALAIAIQRYEQEHYVIDEPQQALTEEEQKMLDEEWEKHLAGSPSVSWEEAKEIIRGKV